MLMTSSFPRVSAQGQCDYSDITFNPHVSTSSPAPPSTDPSRKGSVQAQTPTKVPPATDTKLSSTAGQKPEEKKPEAKKVEERPEDKAPSVQPKTEPAPKAVQSCPLCKEDLNMGSKDPPNYNTCTECKNTVCNLCGFNPMPHNTEVCL